MDLFREIGVAEFNRDIRILTDSSEIANSAHAQREFGQNTVHQLHPLLLIVEFAL